MKKGIKPNGRSLWRKLSKSRFAKVLGPIFCWIYLKSSQCSMWFLSASNFWTPNVRAAIFLDHLISWSSRIYKLETSWTRNPCQISPKARNHRFHGYPCDHLEVQFQLQYTYCIGLSQLLAVHNQCCPCVQVSPLDHWDMGGTTSGWFQRGLGPPLHLTTISRPEMLPGTNPTFFLYFPMIACRSANIWEWAENFTRRDLWSWVYPEKKT
jgi:hypothetical protein